MNIKQVNKTMAQCKIGDIVVSNGDLSYHTKSFFIGTITHKAEDKSWIGIKREDGAPGSGPDFSFQVSNTSSNPQSFLGILQMTTSWTQFKTSATMETGTAVYRDLVGRIVKSALIQGTYIVHRYLQAGTKVELIPWSQYETGEASVYAPPIVIPLMTFFEAGYKASTIKLPMYCVRCEKLEFDLIPCYEGFVCPVCYDENDYQSCDMCSIPVAENTRYAEPQYATNDGGETEEESLLIMCPICYAARRRANQVIQNYTYKPTPIFIPSPVSLTDIYMGLEVEMENRSANSSSGRRPETGLIARKVKEKCATAIIDNEPWFYLKHDGSLTDGMELVTHPATLEAHTTIIPWKNTLEYCKAMGMEADRADTCGLHIHIGKTMFEGQAAYCVNFAKFFATHHRAIEIMAGRPSNRWARYKNANISDNDLIRSEDKYEAINWRPQATVEVRAYKGTLDFLTLMARLEFTHAVATFSKQSTTFQSSWEQFFNYVKTKRSIYTNLLTYMERNNLCV